MKPPKRPLSCDFSLHRRLCCLLLGLVHPLTGSPANIITTFAAESDHHVTRTPTTERSGIPFTTLAASAAQHQPSLDQPQFLQFLSSQLASGLLMIVASLSKTWYPFTALAASASQHRSLVGHRRVLRLYSSHLVIGFSLSNSCLVPATATMTKIQPSLTGQPRSKPVILGPTPRKTLPDPYPDLRVLPKTPFSPDRCHLPLDLRWLQVSPWPDHGQIYNLRADLARSGRPCPHHALHICPHRSSWIWLSQLRSS